MNVPTKPGYDSAQVQREQDDLNRWRFASEIVDVILDTPPDWSVRIGIFGKWGEGKSTVLRFAEQMLKDKQNIVFDFNPWAIQNWNDLWDSFGNAFVAALSAAKVPTGDSLRKVGKNLSKGVGTQMIETAAIALGREKLYNAAFGALQSWLKYDSNQIEAIQKKLQGRRLVVVIDDLDRCAPELIPQLLLSLRELFDLPGFTFLLAFDDEIVGEALIQKNPAWRNGTNFLEKILDFRFHLPPITDAQKQRLIFRAIDQYCAFVPIESVNKIQDLLPDNPRKLKSLIRSLAALKPQIVRHDPDEFNWVDMWLAQMLRLESHPFFEYLLAPDVLEKETGLGYALARELSRRRAGKDEGNDDNKTIKQLIKEVGIDDPALTKRIIQLMAAIRSRASLMFRYSCELAVRPHAVTWKEFRLLREKWSTDQRPATLATWIAEQAGERVVSPDDVEDELFESIVNRRNSLLSEAADSETLKEHEMKADEAGLLLTLSEQFLLGLRKLTPSRFSKLHGQVFYWIGFRKNPADKALREKEEKLLIRLLSEAAPTMTQELLEGLRPWGSFEDDIGDDADTNSTKRELRNKLVMIIAPRVAVEAIELIAQDGGIRGLSERGRHVGWKFCLFNPESPIWETPLWKKLVEAVRKGRKDSIAYQNARDLLELITEGLESRLDFATRQGLSTILAHHEFVKELWGTVTSREIQFRMQIRFIRWRASLINSGVPEDALPLTKGLQSRIDAGQA